MNKKIVVGVIVAVAVIIGVVALASDLNTSNLNLGQNGTNVAPQAPRHYSITLNETAGANAHA